MKFSNVKSFSNIADIHNKIFPGLITMKINFFKTKYILTLSSSSISLSFLSIALLSRFSNSDKEFLLVCKYRICFQTKNAF